MKRTDEIRKAMESLRRRISEEAFSATFTRSAGPGGQNVNKVNTRVTVRLSLGAASGLTAPEVARIRRKLASRIDREGRLYAVSWRFRTQLANRRAATERLFQLLAEALQQKKKRRATRIPKASRLRRLTAKKERAETKRLRRQPDRD